VYAAASSAPQHGPPPRRDRHAPTSRATTRLRRDPVATNRKSLCELGITSMSENSCTTHDARLDSVCDDAPEALRGLAERNFRREKNCEYISPEGCSDAHRERASDRKRPESVPADSQNRARGSVWQALDEAQRRSSTC
jgi:hypothetical protein